MSETIRYPDWFDRVKDSYSIDDEGHLPIGLITYGSLLHPEEINQLFDNPSVETTPVIVEGFERCFNKSVADHLRSPHGDKNGVLNLRRNQDQWFNAILLGTVTVSEFKKYSFREREYGLTQLESHQINFYDEPNHEVGNKFEEIYTCHRSKEAGGGFDPIPEYLELCLNGAEQWGEEFYEDFLRSTYVGKRKLVNYLD